MIRAFQKGDEIAICSIYNYFVENTHHTFETRSIDVKEMLNRISIILIDYPFLVVENEGEIIAYAYATRWKSRQAYDRTVESTIYIKQGLQGSGLGTVLYSELIKQLKQLNIHCVLGGIALPNPSSISLHKKLGFKNSGVLKEVGYKFSNWIDVDYWALHF